MIKSPFRAILTCTAVAALGGCVTATPPASFLAGTDWAIIDVNNVDVSNRSDFTVSFTDSRFDARFGCRRATGRYTLRPTANGDPEPVFQGADATITGQACTGSTAETIGPEILSNAPLTLTRSTEGRLLMLQPPTGIALRPR